MANDNGQARDSDGARLELDPEDGASIERRRPALVANQLLIGVFGDSLVILNPPRQLTKQEAINMAAWLVVLADQLAGDVVSFDDVRAQLLAPPAVKP